MYFGTCLMVLEGFPWKNWGVRCLAADELNYCPKDTTYSKRVLKQVVSSRFLPKSCMLVCWAFTVAITVSLCHDSIDNRINLCPYASKYWRFKSFILHFISPFTITHLFKWLRTSFFSLLISILSSFCWNAEVLICKAFSDWSKFCLLLSFCYLKL